MLARWRSSITPRLQSSITPFAPIVRQFHHVIEIADVIVAADLQDIHQTVVGAGERLEPEQALEFAFEMLGVLETLAVDDLHRAQRADGVARHPDFAVSAVPNQAQQLVIGDLHRLRGRRDARPGTLAVALHPAMLPAGGKQSTAELRARRAAVHLAGRAI